MGFRNMYISASAGSGKTYQLVNRFLALLCLQKLDKGVDVSRIIAITFTRKAAGEFRGRILSALAEGALNAQAAEALWNGRILPTITDPEYGILPGQSITLPGSPTDFFRNVLADVMDQFPRLNLGTIDSLFQRMVRSLIHELGLSTYSNLPPDEVESARRKALDSTCRDTDNNADLCDAIMESTGNEASLSALDSYLLDLVKDYHTAALDSPADAWGGDTTAMTEAQKAAFGLLPQDTEETMTEEEYQPLADEADSCSAGGTQIIQKYAQALSKLKGSIVKGKGDSWSEFEDICAKHGVSLAELEQARRPILIRKLMLRTRALRKLLDTYEKHYAKEVRSHGLFTFDDVPRLLTGHSDGESLARIQERTDSQLEHWLLDEFQDTAKNQYDILRDLLEARAQGDGEGSVLMVGDAKQSIYQFRGGDPRLFIQAREKLFGLNNGTEFSAEQNLAVSFRSAPAVLGLANDLFSDIDRTARCATQAARDTWKALGYQLHETAPAVARKLGPGYAEVRNANKDYKEDGDGAGNIYRNIARILMEVRSRKEYSCAILVRTGKEGVKAAEALNSLRAEFPFKGDIAVCDDKEVGGDSPLGQALMQLFRWLDNPADAQDLSLLKLSPLRPQEATDELAWQKLNDKLAAGGISAVLAHLAPALQDILKANEFLHQRWKTWVDEAAAFDAEGGTLKDWLHRIEQVTVREEPRGNPIRIMTIHKAKGLEFDAVFIPLLSSQHNMADYTKVSLLSSKNEDGSPRAVLLTPPKDKGILPGMPAQNLVYDWQADQEFAGFCELYVAVTRAKHATYIIHDFIGKPEEFLDPAQRDGESYKGMMIQLAHEYPAPERTSQRPDGVITYAKGDPDWWLAGQADAEPEVSAPAAPAEEPAEDYNFPALPRRTPSSMDSDRDLGERERSRGVAGEGKRVVRLRDLGGASFGSTVHALFEGVGWLEEGEEPRLPDGAAPRAAAVVRRALAAPAIAAHFRKPAAPCRLYREQNFEALAGKSWISGQIDRLVVEYDGDTPARARIYDYKTDAEPDPAVLVQTYRTQMEAYRKLVSLAFNLPLSAVSVTLLHVSAATAPEAIEVVG